MRLTTDAGDTTTLSDIIRGHEKQLREQIAEAEKIGGAAGVRKADGLLQKLQKLSAQAGAVGYKLDGTKQKQAGISPELAELRATIARHEQNKSREKFIAEIAEQRAEIATKRRGQ